MEEFYLSYKKEKFSTWFGRHLFESPFLNTSDHRMRPYLFSGLSVNYIPDRFSVTGAWFNHVVSRGSLQWLPIEESSGFYSTGGNPIGSEETYKHPIDSKGVAVLGMEYLLPQGKLRSWNYSAEGGFATSFAEATDTTDLGKSSRFLYRVQGFYQSAVGYGGNPGPDKAYMLPREKTYGVGFRSGIQGGPNQLMVNYLGISDQGRFLFPRE